MLFLWNPLLILLLTQNICTTIVIEIIILLLTYLIVHVNSLRIKVWGFNICAIMSIICHGEIIFQKFAVEFDVPNLYDLHGNYYFNKPNLDQTFTTNEYISHYYTNDQGLRIHENTNPNDTIKECDWLFIGDSFVQGAQVEFENLFTSKLYEKYPNKIIVNAGISGAGLYDELNYFKDKGQQLKPKTVFLEIGVFNDFFNIKERNVTFQDLLLDKSHLYRYLCYNVFTTDSLPLGRWTEPFFPTKQENIDFNILYKESSEQKEADMSAYKQCLKEWKKAADQIGAKLVVFLIPSKEQVSEKLLEEVLTRYKIDENKLSMDKPNELFDKTNKEFGITGLDMTNAFKASENFPFFIQDEHMNEVGHSLIADNLSLIIGDDSTAYELEINPLQHARYPTYNIERDLILYQSQDKYHHYISTFYCKDKFNENIIGRISELIHPTMSSDGKLLAYTEGDQEHSETDVMLENLDVGMCMKLNENDYSASIPSFNRSGNKLAFPYWKNGTTLCNTIAIYDVKEKKLESSFQDSGECWRPIYAIDDSKLYYIHKEKHFVVKSYDLNTKRKEVVIKTDYDIWDIALSPSGKYIVFAGNKDGNWDLFSYSLESKKIKQLTKTLGNEWDPSFGKDDNDIWFAGVFGFFDGVFHKRFEL